MLSRAALLALVLLSLSGVDAGRRLLARRAGALAILDCRGACFAFARLSCASVELGCGRDHGIVVLGGLPFDCADVEPVACGLGAGDPLAACLAVCGGEDYPYAGQ
jgi:hypothetical protein